MLLWYEYDNNGEYCEQTIVTLNAIPLAGFKLYIGNATEHVPNIVESWINENQI